MHGHTLTRLARIPWALARRPKDFTPYLTHGPWRKKSPLELRLPWFSYAAIDHIDGALKSTDRVCELGGGGSTLWFAKRAATVVTLESDPAWGELLRQTLAAENLLNATVINAELSPPFTPFDAESYLSPLRGQVFDWVILDFKDDQFERRPATLRWIETNLLPGGGVLVVDDSWRYPDLIRASRASRKITCKSLGPARPGVTSTDLLYYPPPGASLPDRRTP